jgi:hypothetical protein
VVQGKITDAAEIKKLKRELDLLNRECDIYYKCLMELYNIDAAAPIIKKCFAKAKKIPKV